MRTAYTGRGYMTAAVDALTRVALVLPGVERVAIRHDVASAASAAVAAKAGFVSRFEGEPEASRSRVNVSSMRRGMQTGDQVHSPPSDRRRILCYREGVAVLISVDVVRRLMGYLKPFQAPFVFRVVSTRVINAAA